MRKQAQKVEVIFLESIGELVSDHSVIGRQVFRFNCILLFAVVFPPILESIMLKFICYFYPPLKGSVFIKCLK